MYRFFRFRKSNAQHHVYLVAAWRATQDELVKIMDFVPSYSVQGALNHRCCVRCWCLMVSLHFFGTQFFLAPTPAARSGEFIKHSLKASYSTSRQADFERLPIVNSKICPVRGRGLRKPSRISVKGSWNVCIPFWAMCAWPTFILHQPLGWSWQICFGQQLWMGRCFQDVIDRWPVSLNFCLNTCGLPSFFRTSIPSVSAHFSTHPSVRQP